VVVGERRRLRRRRGVGRGVTRLVAPLVVVAVIVVLAVGSLSQIGPASGPDRQTVDRSFAVLAAPIAEQSNASGSALTSLVSDGPSLERTALFAALSSLTTNTAENDRQFAALTPPVPSGDAAARCQAAMDDRARAVSQVSATFENLLGGSRGVGGGDEAAAARSLDEAATVLEAADGSWAACRRALRRAPGSARLPVSTWMSDPGLWDEGAVGQLVAAMVSSATLAPVHRLALLAVSTDPASVPGAGAVSVLPPTTALHVVIVVADQGNVEEDGVKVVVSAVPQATARTPGPVRATTDIGAGHSVTVEPPTLSVRPGSSYVLDVTVTAQSGVSTSLSLPVGVSALPPPPTTTTTVPPTTTRPKSTRTTLKTSPTTSTTTRPG
jgi:hypothetical protein